MKLFKCTHCGQLLYFENQYCENCGYGLGYVAAESKLYPLVQQPNGNYKIYNGFALEYRYCANYEYQACNWLVAANGSHLYCEACETNHTVPDLSNDRKKQLWQNIEIAKHRLVYTLLQLKLPLISKKYDQQKGLAFDFLADDNPKEKVTTGHDMGLITINISEADDSKREKERLQMDEPYRTMLGHLRHESGHYYWDLLIANSEFLTEYRQLFGDERLDYAQALKHHYEAGPKQNWNLQYISAYASSHPWEDWAETWAHYLHIVDTLETAYAFGLNVAPRIANVQSNLNAEITVNPYHHSDFKTLIDLWLPLTYAMNSLNRSMGNHDLYPFVIPEKVIDKLGFIHKICIGSGAA